MFSSVVTMYEGQKQSWMGYIGFVPTLYERQKQSWTGYMGFGQCQVGLSDKQHINEQQGGLIGDRWLCQF